MAETSYSPVVRSSIIRKNIMQSLWEFILQDSLDSLPSVWDSLYPINGNAPWSVMFASRGSPLEAGHARPLLSISFQNSILLQEKQVDR